MFSVNFLIIGKVYLTLSFIFINVKFGPLKGLVKSLPWLLTDLEKLDFQIAENI